MVADSNNNAQPALLYVVPCTLVPLIVAAYIKVSTLLLTSTYKFDKKM